MICIQVISWGQHSGVTPVGGVRKAGLGTGRNQTVKKLQQNSRPMSRDAPELGDPRRAVLNGGQRARLSDLRINQSLDGGM